MGGQPTFLLTLYTRAYVCYAVDVKENKLWHSKTSLCKPGQVSSLNATMDELQDASLLSVTHPDWWCSTNRQRSKLICSNCTATTVSNSFAATAQVIWSTCSILHCSNWFGATVPNCVVGTDLQQLHCITCSKLHCSNWFIATVPICVVATDL